MAEYDGFYRCTIGTTGLSVVDYSHHEEKVVREASGLLGGAVGKKIVVRVKAFIIGATPAVLQANLLAAKESLADNGIDFRLYANGLTDPQVSILAARCIDGGPHFEFDVMEQGEAGALRKNINFTLTAQTARVGSGGGEDAVTIDDHTTFDLKVEIRADDLETVTRSGEIRGPNILDIFYSALAAFETQYPAPLYTLSHEYELGTFEEKSGGTIVQQGDVLKYKLVAVENADPLPGPGTEAVEGTASMGSDRDEHHRMVETWEFDLLIGVGGNAERVLAAIKTQLPQGRVPQRESVQTTSIRERRLRASFTFLRSADGDAAGDGLMNWTQSFRIMQQADTYEEKQYPGLDPILIKKPKALARLVQSGTAVWAGEAGDPPDPLFPDSLAELPEVTKTQIDDVQISQEWNYAMFVEGNVSDLSKQLLGRPRGG